MVDRNIGAKKFMCTIGAKKFIELGPVIEYNKGPIKMMGPRFFQGVMQLKQNFSSEGALRGYKIYILNWMSNILNRHVPESAMIVFHFILVH